MTLSDGLSREYLKEMRESALFLLAINGTALISALIQAHVDRNQDLRVLVSIFGVLSMVAISRILWGLYTTEKPGFMSYARGYLTGSVLYATLLGIKYAIQWNSPQVAWAVFVFAFMNTFGLGYLQKATRNFQEHIHFGS